MTFAPTLPSPDDESIAFTFSGDTIARLDVTAGDQAAVDDFWG